MNEHANDDEPATLDAIGRGVPEGSTDEEEASRQPRLPSESTQHEVVRILGTWPHPCWGVLHAFHARKSVRSTSPGVIPVVNP